MKLAVGKLTAARPTLPPELLLPGAEPTCPALRSGRSWMLIAEAGVDQFRLDLPTLTLTDSAASSGTLSDEGNRHFMTGFGGHWVVAPSGLIVAHCTGAPVTCCAGTARPPRTARR